MLRRWAPRRRNREEPWRAADRGPAWRLPRLGPRSARGPRGGLTAESGRALSVNLNSLPWPSLSGFKGFRSRTGRRSSRPASKSASSPGLPSSASNLAEDYGLVGAALRTRNVLVPRGGVPSVAPIVNGATVPPDPAGRGTAGAHHRGGVTFSRRLWSPMRGKPITPARDGCGVNGRANARPSTLCRRRRSLESKVRAYENDNTQSRSTAMCRSCWSAARVRWDGSSCASWGCLCR